MMAPGSRAGNRDPEPHQEKRSTNYLSQEFKAAHFIHVRAGAILLAMAKGPWTSEENDLIVRDYFTMLVDDLAGRGYNKARHNRRLQQDTGRSKGSIEYKFQNISAVLQLSGEVWIPGYKPAMNFQKSLVDAVERWLDAHPDFLSVPLISNNANTVRDADHRWIGPPPAPGHQPAPKDQDKVEPLLRKFDFAGQQARNRELGRAGEKFVLDNERWSLQIAGRSDLAEQVRWVSQEEGDGAGYDIASFRPDGHERLIEVKTTRGWDRTPFYISPNELKVANRRRDEWYLLRVWNFQRNPRAFELRPPLDQHLTFTPANYLAAIR